MGNNRQKQIAQAKESSANDAEFSAKLLAMLLQTSDFTNEQIVGLINESRKSAAQATTAAKELKAIITAIMEADASATTSLKESIDREKVVAVKNAIALIEPGWIAKMHTDTKKIESRLDAVVKAINEKEVATQLEITNDVKVHLTEPVEVNEPKWYKPFDGDTFLNKAIIAFKKGLQEILKSATLKVESDRPLRVIVTDARGKAIDLTPRQQTSSGGGIGGGGPEAVRIKDASGELINPATEETLADVLAASGGSVYNFIQKDEGATYIYYGFTNGTQWRIKRKTIATGIWMIANGTGDYDDAWTDRSIQTYSYA